MASYIESSLGRGERIVYKAQVSWFSQFWRIFFGILLLMWVIGIVFIVFAVLNVMTTELAFNITCHLTFSTLGIFQKYGL